MLLVALVLHAQVGRVARRRLRGRLAVAAVPMIPARPVPPALACGQAACARARVPRASWVRHPLLRAFLAWLAAKVVPGSLGQAHSSGLGE